MAVFRVERTRDYTVIQSSSEKPVAVAEGKGASVRHAVAAG